MKQSNERYTPEWILNLVREYGNIDVDPCTTPCNRTLAAVYYTAGDDGLSRPWLRRTIGGVAWVNPPYSRGCLTKWVEACWENSQAIPVIALIPSDLGSQAGQLVARTADAICFVRGRIAFLGQDEQPLKQGAKQPSIIPYWGGERDRFAEVFGKVGVVWKR